VLAGEPAHSLELDVTDFGAQVKLNGDAARRKGRYARGSAGRPVATLAAGNPKNAAMGFFGPEHGTALAADGIQKF